MTWTEDQADAVRIIFGTSEGWFRLAGRSVAIIHESLAVPLAIPADAVAIVNGKQVGPSHVLQARDTLEFVLASGKKGVGQQADSSLSVLRRFCNTLLCGPVADVHSLELMLGPIWDTLPSDDPSMTGNKLLNRMERPIWNPPVLVFRIERHGAASLGSSRAEVQEWTVDLERMTTTVNIVARRQVRPPQQGFDVKPVAAELCNAIIAGNQDDRLKWEGDSKVRVLIGKVLPEKSAVKDTLAGRRKRLRDELTRLLVQARWKPVRPNVYERQK